MVTATPRVGVLALQGAVAEHVQILRSLGAEVIEVRHEHELAGVHGIVIPGGESTAMARIAAPKNLFLEIRRRAESGSLAVFGTCAGLILLAAQVSNPGPLSGFDTIGLLDVTVERNAYGNQLGSFEASITLRREQAGPLVTIEGAFIRAPRIAAVGSEATVCAALGGEPVGVVQGLLLGVTFHPEITGNPELHRYFLDLCRSASSSATRTEHVG